MPIPEVNEHSDCINTTTTHLLLLEKMMENIRKAIKNPKGAYRYAWKRRWKPLDSAITNQIGWFAFDYDWKLLIVLDAFRFDLAKESMAADQLGEPNKIWSVGADSPRWIERTFQSTSPRVLQNTAYISANPFTNHAPEILAMRNDVQRYAFDKEIGTTPPRAVTDQAVAIGRDTSLDRYVVHYMQPHLPPLESQSDMSNFVQPPDSDQESTNPWRDIEEGLRDGEKVEAAYRNNVSTVISDVKLLLKNFDAEKAIITADHGNFLSEWGRWGHRYRYSIHPAVRYVPYWVTSASDEKEYTPSEYNKNEESVSPIDRLRAMGYRK